MKPDADRLVSLDAFRGAAIAAMILVNNPGDGANVYWPFDHAPWHGWIKWAGPGGTVLSLQERIYRAFFVPWASPINASLAFALATIAFWYLVLLWMDRRGIYLKV